MPLVFVISLNTQPSNIMKRRFTLPIVIAALLHAGLLLGFRGHSETTTVSQSRLSRPIISDPAKFEVIPEPDTETEAVKPPSGIEHAAPPSPPERPQPVHGDDFPFEVPKHEEVSRTELMTIPLGSVGIGSGYPEGFGNLSGLIVGARELDGRPIARHQSRPIYPAEARRDGRAGEVLVAFTVDESGGVHEPRAVRSTDRGFEEAAVRAVALWRFEPGRRNGQVVRFRMAVPIVFTLDGN